MIELNSKQLEAVQTAAKNTFVVAGAGTGKTRVLTFRIKHLLDKGIDPKEIVAFTFTNKAANEMKVRLRQMTTKVSELSISTFHSYCFYYLNFFHKYIGFEDKINIIDDQDKTRIIRKIISDNNFDSIDKEIIANISKLKNHQKFELKTSKDSLELNAIFTDYQAYLRKSSCMDFDDILYYFYKLISTDEDVLEQIQSGAKYILIDECQDINKIQFDIVSKLMNRKTSIFMVGDEDQTIYTFRGSKIDTLNEFIRFNNFEIIVLEENYRSKQNILDIANRLIHHNQSINKKNLFTSNKDREYKILIKTFNHVNQEALYIRKVIEALHARGSSYKDMVILYRNNNLSTPFEKELLSGNIPYVIHGSHAFYSYKEIKLLLSVIKVALNPNDDVSMHYVLTNLLNVKSSYLDKIDSIQDMIELSIYEVISQDDEAYSKAIKSAIDDLNEDIKSKSILEFIDKIIKDYSLEERITKEQNSKDKLRRIYDFRSMLQDESINTSIDKFLENIYLNSSEKDKDIDAVTLMTIHQAKGLEYKTVFLVSLNEGILPNKTKLDTNLEEERRIFYVGITRAKERLILTSSYKTVINGMTKSFMPSTFLLELEERVEDKGGDYD